MLNVIYKIRNVVNGKIYIGSAENSKLRFERHRRHLRKGDHHCAHLQSSWNKHGEDCFKFEIIEQVEGNLLEAEQRHIDLYYGNGKCYNTAKYAGAPMRGRVHSEKTRELLKEVSPKGEDHYNFGKQLTEETRALISTKCKGLPNKMKGQKMSEQGRLNVSASVKRGEECHFYGKRPANADDLQKAIHATLPDRTTQTFDSLTIMRDTLGVSIATIIRACKSGNPIKFGVVAGWVLSYENAEHNEAPHIPEEFADLPRTRQAAKDINAPLYFTGLPCTRGHISPKKLKGSCVACCKEDYKKYNDRKKK